MEETARAKLNLALHVRGREPDGYHRIETIFAFCTDGDLLRVAAGEDLGLELVGPFAAGLAAEHDNLVLRAARALAERHAPGRGARLTLDKRLPVASGIGGGSADAAAALRLLDRWWGLDLGEAGLLDIARGLGADVPACLLSRPTRGTGRGDVLEEIEDAPFRGLPALLVNPRVAVSTPAVFRAWDGVDRGPLPGDVRDGRNDLQPAAIAVAPIVADCLRLLGERFGATLVRMSGSGATCFALFDNEVDRDRAAAKMAEERPGWWRLATRLA
ncbi:4-(cytidine 5'-diphospho)-2-C-methyl-D-erythritol kinase [Sphingomonas parva]|nr:4-(cytidine 5'-diphospho)-2-C-methyl-D-erythritol kinase [Sphingomonas parva]